MNHASIHKLKLLLGVLAADPREFATRLAIAMEVLIDRLIPHSAAYSPTDVDQALARLSTTQQIDLTPYLAEKHVMEVESEVMRRLGDLSQAASFSSEHNADLIVARLCYAFCRALSPNLVVETGVAHGVTSAFLLKAMHVNGRGSLHSFDLPPLNEDSDERVGAVVPFDLRSRWSLHRGSVRRWLGPFLREAGSTVDLFVHDSLHTRRHMEWEFRTVKPFLSRHCTVIADDVEGNKAFAAFVSNLKPGFYAVVRQETKRGLTGICVTHRGGPVAD